MEHLAPVRSVGLRKLPTLITEVGKTHSHGIAEGLQSLGIKNHDLLDGRAVRPRQEHFVELFLVFDKNNAGLTVVDQVFHLRRGICRIYPGGNTTATQYAKIRKKPFLIGVRQNASHITNPKAAVIQCQRDLHYLLTQIAPGQCPPDSQALVSDDDFVGPLLNPGPKKAAQRAPYIRVSPNHEIRCRSMSVRCWQRCTLHGTVCTTWKNITATPFYASIAGCPGLLLPVYQDKIP